jgi:hypothetical protein
MIPLQQALPAHAVARFPAAFQEIDLVAFAMLASFLGILAMALGFLWLIGKERTATTLAPTGANHRTPKDLPHADALPAWLQEPTRWIAIQSTHLPAVLAALPLRNRRYCSLEEGLAEAREHRFFITPPMHRQWILVFGADLPDPAEDVDECFHLLRHLSQQLGRVQFFSRHAPVNHHAWAWAEQGRIVRGYAWAGRTLWNQGAMTAAEQAIGMRCLDYEESEEESGGFPGTGSSANLDRLPLLAARWSVDPLSLGPIADEAMQGVSGEPSSQRLR